MYLCIFLEVLMCVYAYFSEINTTFEKGSDNYAGKKYIRQIRSLEKKG